MKIYQKISCILVCLFLTTWPTPIKDLYPFNKVIIWGHKFRERTHTHAWIHWAFYRAFTHLGYETYWVDDRDSIKHLDLKNSLFITEGQVDQHIPLRQDCRYILHNCQNDQYKHILAAHNAINLQVFTYDVLERDVVQVEPFIFTDVKGKTIYMPWATDLLPHEIDIYKKKAMPNKKSRTIYWVGTFYGGTFGNTGEIYPFLEAAKKNKIAFKVLKDIDMHANIQKIQQSYMAPAIVGIWQKDKGYIPCRIFKNISYGQMGITNSKAVYDLFEGKIVYNPDTAQLFYDAQKKIETMKTDELRKLMQFVRDHHTYINRIECLLTFMNKVKPIR